MRLIIIVVGEKISLKKVITLKIYSKKRHQNSMLLNIRIILYPEKKAYYKFPLMAQFEERFFLKALCVCVLLCNVEYCWKTIYAA